MEVAKRPQTVQAFLALLPGAAPQAPAPTPAAVPVPAGDVPPEQPRQAPEPPEPPEPPGFF